MQGQDLSDGNAYANIVGVPTRYDTQMNPHFSCQHLNRVEPGVAPSNGDNGRPHANLSGTALEGGENRTGQRAAQGGRVIGRT